MVSAIILAGGFGTRLAAVVPHVPKALAPIQGEPFLRILLKSLEGFIDEAVFALGHKADAIVDFLAEEECSFPIKTVTEKVPLGTGGALLNAVESAEYDTLLVMNGDTHFDLPFEEFLAFHKANKSDLTFAALQMEDTSRYGSLVVDGNRVINFREKVPGSGWISIGMYLMEKSLLKEFPQGSSSLERDLFPQMLEKRVFAFPFKGSFIDIGTPQSYEEAQRMNLCRS